MRFLTVSLASLVVMLAACGKSQPAQLELGSHKPQRWRTCAEYRGRPERTHHFVIPHVDDPEVACMAGAFPGYRKDGVRVDRGDTGVDDFELRLREAFGQQHFQVMAFMPCSSNDLVQGAQVASLASEIHYKPGRAKIQGRALSH